MHLNDCMQILIKSTMDTTNLFWDPMDLQEIIRIVIVAKAFV